MLCSCKHNITGPQQPTMFPNGMIVRKNFANVKFHEGEVISYDTVNQYTKSNTVSATARNLINNNFTAITNIRNDILHHPKCSSHR